VQEELELNGHRYLDYLSRLAAEAGVTSEKVMRHGMPYEEITDLAREQGVDLIVIGQMGSHGSRRGLIGNVAERVIECAPCPVLVVK
jgi:nucleotide-binding universal stress UspA family protein